MDSVAGRIVVLVGFLMWVGTSLVDLLCFRRPARW